MKRVLSFFLSVSLLLSLITAGAAELAFEAKAATSGYYTYSVSNGKATIIRVDVSIGSDVTIPSTLDGYTVTGIGRAAFRGCTALQSVTIPDSVTRIGHNAFSECTSLQSVCITDLAAWCGIMFSGAASTPMCNGANLYLNGELVTDLVIPDGVTSIGYYAFYNCDSLQSVTIPSGVTSIGHDAFSECTSLQSVTIPDSVTSIGYNAFFDCNSLRSVSVSDSLTSIGRDAFHNTAYYNNINNWENGVLYIDNYLIKAKDTVSGACSIKDGTKVIANAAFSDCTGLQSVSIPDGITSIGDYTFNKCTSLQSVTIPDSVTGIGDFAFFGCISLQSIAIPDSMTSIGSAAFEYCTSLQSVNIGSGVTEIWLSAFDKCTSLQSVYITDLAAWCGIMFFDDTAHPLCNGANLYLNGELVTDLVIPDDVTSIEGHVFYNCDSLQSVIIPDSVTNIGSSAFEDCDALRSVNIPDSVVSIWIAAFESCDSLQSVTIPDSVTSVGYDAFSECTSLRSVNIPDSVTSMGHDAFYNTAYYNDISNWKNGVLYIDNYLIEAKETVSGACSIREGVKVIADSAFSGCTGLQSVSIPDGVMSIGEAAFLGCSALQSMTIPDSVTSIGRNAFFDCTSLQSVTIPDGVTSIGSEAFSDCTALQSVTISDSVTRIGSNAFGNTAYYNTADNWENDVLYIDGCLIEAKDTISGEYTVKNGTKVIAHSAFYGCDLLQSVSIPDGVARVGGMAFFNCSSLQSVSIPGSVTSIGSSAFYDTAYYNTADNWENDVLYIDGCLIEAKDTISGEYTIKNGTKVIAQSAFSNCMSLQSVTIPDSVKNIGSAAFEHCTALADVYYGGREADRSGITIDLYDTNAQLLNAAWHYAAPAGMHTNGADSSNTDFETPKTTVDADAAVADKGNFPWWGIVIAVIVVAAIAVGVIVTKKKGVSPADVE